MIMPFGTYMTPNRLIGLPAVFCIAESAGMRLTAFRVHDDAKVPAHA